MEIEHSDFKHIYLLLEIRTLNQHCDAFSFLSILSKRGIFI